MTSLTSSVLHGAFCTINDLRSQMVPLSKHRRVIALEYQGHGRTADIDRPLSYTQLADDAAAFLKQLNIPVADIFGYSLGGAIALHLAIRHPSLVRKLIIVSSSFSPSGFPPEVLAALHEFSAAQLAGSRFETEYKRLAPHPERFENLVEKVSALNKTMKAIPEEDLRDIKAPTFVLVGDSDYVTTEHAVEMFKLRGGGVVADFVALPKSQLAIIPATSHLGMMERPWVAEMIEEFLERED
jgi:pimeloyl-ACP methyl ester carboxylesterase